MPTFEQALKTAYETRWHGLRSAKGLYTQARIGITTLGGMHLEVSEVTQADLLKARHVWLAEKLSPATINYRFACLSVLGVDVKGCRARKPRTLKWWLRPEALEDLLNWSLVQDPERFPFASILADYAVWAAMTGLRVEESLRLERSSFSDGFTLLTVPGTKTQNAQRTLPILPEATALVKKRFTADPSSKHLFPIKYAYLNFEWVRARTEIGITDPLATLKAFRRSAARKLHNDHGMPLDLLRQYLGHGDIQTTMGYLRLTGGYSTEEMRRFM